MKWTRVERPSKRLPLSRVVRWTTTSSARNWTELKRDFVEFWVKGCEVVQEVMDGLPDVAWDSLFCGLSEQGGFTLDPGLDNPPLKLEPVMILMSSEYVTRQCWAIDELLDDNAKWRQALAAFWDELERSCFSALRSAPAKRALMRLQKWHDYKIMIYREDDFRERKELHLKSD